MKIEIYIPIFHEHRKKEILDFIKEGMDKLGIFQYKMKEKIKKETDTWRQF